jgi:serine/threonine protein kinase
MTPERWQQIRNVFEHAQPLSQFEREPYLAQACAGDPELRLEVDSLLKAASEAGSAFMDRPAADLMQAPQDSASSQARIGRRLGPYQIVAEIGRGGMGEVYRAVRIEGQFEQQVAIKLVRVGMGRPSSSSASCTNAKSWPRSLIPILPASSTAAQPPMACLTW